MIIMIGYKENILAMMVDWLRKLLFIINYLFVSRFVIVIIRGRGIRKVGRGGGWGGVREGIKKGRRKGEERKIRRKGIRRGGKRGGG